MFLRRCVIVLALAGCPQLAPPEPPRGPPPTVGGGGQGLQTPEPVGPREVAPIEEAPDGRPALSAPGGGEALGDIVAPRGRERQAHAGGCQEGAHQAGESWRVECNTCHCGVDGQVTCTLMACNVSGPRPG